MASEEKALLARRYVTDEGIVMEGRDLTGTDAALAMLSAAFDTIFEAGMAEEGSEDSAELREDAATQLEAMATDLRAGRVAELKAGMYHSV